MNIPVMLRRTHNKLVANLQHLTTQVMDILSGVSLSSDKYKGSSYTSYDSMVSQLSKMYDGKADWGNQLAKNIIDVRSAFVVGGGIKVVPIKVEPKLASREIDFINEFIEHNNLNEEKPQDWAKEAEIEGKFLCRLFPNEEKKQIDARFIPYTAHKYIVETDSDDYEEYTKVSYKINGSGADVTIDPKEFIYKKFGGRTHMVNETPSKTAMIITSIENLDKALYDWRKINHLFASPTPHLKCATADEAEKMNELIQKVNWKIGKALVTTAEYTLVGMGAEGKESLLQEIVTYIKIISGAVGVPVHFLGMPDLMSNRATSNDLFELINAATDKERKIWSGSYQEIFQKALIMANNNFNKGFNPTYIGAELPFISERKMQELIDIWLPLFTSNVIDLDTILSKIPEIDAKKIKENKQNDLMAQLDQMKANEAELIAQRDHPARGAASGGAQ